jgi:DNA-directed RNA polymerase sigma subunit (sigma70/sigma32)
MPACAGMTKVQRIRKAPMTDLAELRSTRPALSPAARALRLQRIFARMQEGASYSDIAAEEGLSRERLRQIVRAASARRGDPLDHRKMQFARLEPALRLASRRATPRPFRC